MSSWGIELDCNTVFFFPSRLNSASVPVPLSVFTLALEVCSKIAYVHATCKIQTVMQSRTELMALSRVTPFVFSNH